MLPAESRTAIERRLADYLASADDKSDLTRLAQRYNAFPIYSDVGGTLFLSPSGEVLSLKHVEDDDTLQTEKDPRWRITAVVVASEKFPELAFLLPPRPVSEPDCAACGGSGRVTSHRLRCGECFGLGWKIDRPGR